MLARHHPQLFLVNAVTYLFLVGALLLVTVPDVRGATTRSEGGGGC